MNNIVLYDMENNKYIKEKDLISCNLTKHEYELVLSLIEKEKIYLVKSNKKFIPNIYDRKLLYRYYENTVYTKKPSRGELIISNLHIVRYLLCIYNIKYGINIAEYESYATEGLIEAIDTYDSGKGTFFKYSKEIIMNKLDNRMNIDYGLSNKVIEKYIKELEQVKIECNNINDKELIIELLNRLLEKNDISKSEYDYILERNNIFSYDKIENDLELLIGNNAMKDIVNYLFNNMKIKTENIFRLYYGIGERKHTLEEIGNIYECSKSNVGQYINKAKLIIINDLIKKFGTIAQAKESLIYNNLNSFNNNEKDLIDYEFNEDIISIIFDEYINDLVSHKNKRLLDLNKNKMIEIANSGNDKAMFLALRTNEILDCTKWISKSEALKIFPEGYKVNNNYDIYTYKTYISLSEIEKINMIFKYFKRYLELPKEDNEIITKKYGFKMYSWIKENSLVIKQEAVKGNTKAMFLALRLLLISPIDAIKYMPYNTKVDGINLYYNVKCNISVERAVEIIFNYYKINNCKPSLSEENKLYGCSIIEYLEENKDYVKLLAITNNDKAMYICLKNKWISKKVSLNTYPNNYIIDGVKMYESYIDLSEKLLIDKIFRYMKNSTDMSQINKFIENNKELIIDNALNHNKKAAFISLRYYEKDGLPILNIMDILDIYGYEAKIDNISLYNGIYDLKYDAVDFLYGYYKKYYDIKSNNYINTEMIYMYNRKYILEKVRINDKKAIIIEKLFNKSYTDSEVHNNKLDVMNIINKVYEDYICYDIKPDNNLTKEGNYLRNNTRLLIKEVNNGNIKAKELLYYYKDKYISISSINTLALKLCLENNWLLRKEAREYKTYYRLKGYSKVKKMIKNDKRSNYR